MKVLVTAGPTREHIDAVRFITNASSGRMGYAVAAAAAEAGMEVTLLSGPVALATPGGCEVVRFVTVAELKAALEARFAACDALVMAAAVGDFTVDRVASGKLHRDTGPLTLTLRPTPDLLAGLAAQTAGAKNRCVRRGGRPSPGRPGRRCGQAGCQGGRLHRGQHLRGHVGRKERGRHPRPHVAWCCRRRGGARRNWPA